MKAIVLFSIFLPLVCAGDMGFGLGARAFPAFSSLRLLSVPEKFDQREVQITGWLHIANHEESPRFQLYAIEEAMKYSDPTLVILLDEASLSKLLSSEKGLTQKEAIRRLEGKYVLVQGRFEWFKTPQGQPECMAKLTGINYLLQTDPEGPAVAKPKVRRKK